MESTQAERPTGAPPLSTTTPITPPPVTGTVVNETTPPPTSTKKISSAAVGAISAGIGVGNVCCGPVCNTCPTFISSAVGIILYFVWKDQDPKAAKTILMVTIITGVIALGLFGILFALGFASSLLDSF